LIRLCANLSVCLLEKQSQNTLLSLFGSGFVKIYATLEKELGFEAVSLPLGPMLRCVACTEIQG
jgi:hypothetical protein